MKNAIRAFAALVLVAASFAASAQNIRSMFVDRYTLGQTFVNIWDAPALLPNALVPQQSNNTFLCNASGSTAVPYECAIGTGLSFSSNTLNVTQTPPTIGSPNSRSLSFGTAYQATTSTKPAVVTVNLSSTASLTLGGGTTNTAVVYMGSTTSVNVGTGTAIGTYSNAFTGTVVIGVALSNASTQTVTFALPAGWYFAVLQSAGSVTVSSAFDQSVG